MNKVMSQKQIDKLVKEINGDLWYMKLVRKIKGLWRR